MSAQEVTQELGMQTTKLQQGARRFEEVMGVPAQQFVRQFEAVAPDFGNYVLEWEFGEVYGREGLDLRTREIVIIASCATLGTVGVPAMKMHIGAAMRLGVTQREISEVLMQLAFSAGLPTAIAAMEAASEVFRHTAESTVDQQATAESTQG